MELYTYLLKLSISLAVVFAFYWLLLRRLTFYNWNRWFLLLYPAIAFLIPFINVSSLLQQHQMEDAEMISYIPLLQLDAAKPAASFDIFSIILIVFGAGSVLMLVKLLLQYWSLRRIRSQAVLLADEGVKLYHIDKSIIPFSFGKSIYFNRALHSDTELKEIIRHEFIHVKQHHSFDILWGELLCLLNWYNPFAWLIRKAIRQNLEFIADRQVLASGLDRKQYQYILLKVTGISSYSIVSNFNFSSLKKRIAMMNRSKSARLNLARFALILPLLAVVLLAFRSVVHNNPATANHPASIIENSYLDKYLGDTVPAKKVPEKIKKNLEQIEHVHVLNNKMTLTLKNGSVEQYNLDLPAEKKAFESKYGEYKEPIPPMPPVAPAARGKVPAPAPAPAAPHGVNGTPASAPNPSAPPTPPAAPKPVVFSFSTATGGDPLIYVDGELFTGTKEDLNNIDPASIKRIDVLKNADAISIYGEKAKDGVINIYTKNYSSQPITVVGKSAPGAPVKSDPSLEPITVVGKPAPESSVSVSGTGSTQGTATFNVNGRVAETSTGEVSGPIHVTAGTDTDVKGNAVISKDGDKVTVTDLKGKISLDKFPGSIVVDGKNYTSEAFKKLNLSPDQIESVDVLKHAVSHDKKDINGVIIIKTKK